MNGNKNADIVTDESVDVSENKTKYFSKVSSNANYDDLAEQNLKKIQKRNMSVTILILITIVCVLLSNFIIEYNAREYVGGNVLNINCTDNIVSRAPRYFFESPWSNASLTGSLLFRTLFETDSTFTEINPSIASSVDISSDGLTYDIKLKTEEMWSDGSLITVDDVVFSIHAFLQLEDVNNNIYTAFNNIAGVYDFVNGNADTISGITTFEDTITIKLETRYNNFAIMLTQFTPLPKHIISDMGDISESVLNKFLENPICSGMYMYSGQDENKNFVLTQNQYYSDKISEIERIVLYWDWSNIDLDYHVTTDITDMVTYNSMKGFVEYPVNVYFYSYFVFNIEGEDGNKNEAMDNVLFRQAVSHALDQETLLSNVYYNNGQLLFSGSTSDLSGDAYPYNPELAKSLLYKSGYDLSRPFVICYYHSDPTTLIFLDKVQSYLEAIGLTVELVTSYDRDNGRISDEFIYIDREYDMLFKGLSSFDTEEWYNEYLSSHTTMSALFGTKGLFDEKVLKLSSATFQDEYNVALEEIIDLEQELIYKIPLFTLSQMVYINENRVKMPREMTFGNVKYFSDLRFDEWQINKQ